MKRINTVNAPRALDIKGQPHQLSYITAEEAEILKALGGSGRPGPMGIPSYQFGDDFADFEGGGADARGGGSNYDSSPTGQQGPSFSSDEGDSASSTSQNEISAREQALAQAEQAAALRASRDANFARQVALGQQKDYTGPGQTTIGFSVPGAGTTIRGNVIQGGKITGFSPGDIQNEQTLASFGFGDERSDAFKSFLTDTGATLQNPFGKSNVLSRGKFSQIFDAKDLDYSRSLTPEQRMKTLEKNFLNYVTPATKQRFGSILGSAEGEKSLYGDRVRGVRPQSLQEGIAGLALGSMVPFGGMLEKRNRTRFAAPGMLPEGFEQPQGGLLEQFLGGFGGILQPQPDTTLRELDKLRQAGSDLIQRGREAGGNLMRGIRSLISDPQADQIVDTVRPMESRADIIARTTQRGSVPTAAQELLGMGGDIQNSLRQSQEVSPQLDTIPGARPFARMERKTISQPYRTTPEQQRLMHDISQGMNTAGLDSESRTNFLNTIISQAQGGGAVYNSAGVPVISYTPERAINPATGQIYGDDDRAADYQIAAARLLKEPNQSFKLPTR